MKCKQLFAAVMGTAVIVSMAAGCSGGKGKSGDLNHLAVSGISSTSQYLPVYVAEKKGWFTEAGLEIEDVMFTSGPVQMESLSSDSWDIGLTGIGGVLAGAIRYDALIVSASSTDIGQYVFARKDFPIVAAGKGNNTLSPDIYGDAETWKGVKALCSTGTVLQYTLVKTLKGFDMSKDDVNFVAMDGPTIYSSFLAGEGDICVMGNAAGAFTLLGLPDEYVPISDARQAKTGLITNIMANKNSYNDEKKFVSMKEFLKIYFKAAQWIDDNPEEAAQYMLDFSEEGGTKTDLETCKNLLAADRYYTAQEAYQMATDQAEGQDCSSMEADLKDTLQFFIDTGSYRQEDQESFKNHVDARLITDVYQSMK